MADIRSAAGEGSEPQVPDQDQPAQELANLIAQSSAQSDAKGKGFWRRRRRKNTSVPEPSTPPTATTPDPAGTAEPASTPESNGAPNSASTPESNGAPDSTPRSTGTTDSGGTPVPAGTEESGDQSAAGSEATDDAAQKPSPDADSAAADSQIEPSADAGEADADKPVSEDEPTTSPADEPASDEASGESSDGANEATSDAAEAKPAAAAVEGTQQPVAPARPAVGVVYEPDESPDGFPLDYGNIIVGLPKSEKSEEQAAPETGAESSDDASAEAEAGAEEQSAEAATDESAAGEADPSATEQAGDAPTEPPAEAADERAEGAPAGPSAEAADEHAEDAPAGPSAEAADERAEDAPAEQGEAASKETGDNAPDGEAGEATSEADGATSAAAAGAGDSASESDAADAGSEGADEPAAEQAEADQSGETAADDSAGDAEPAAGDAETAAGDAEGAAEQGDGDDSAGDAGDDAAVDASGEQGGADGDVADESSAGAEAASEDGGEGASAGEAGEGASEGDGEAGPAGEAEGGAAAAEGAADDGSEGADESAGEQAEAGETGGAAAGESAGDAQAVAEQGVAASAGSKKKAKKGGSAAKAGEAGSGGDGESGSAAEAEEGASGDGSADAGSGGSGESGAEQGEVASEDGGVDAPVAEGAEGDPADEAASEEGGAAEEAVVELTAEELAERLAAEQAAMALITALMKLRGALANSQLPLDVVGADEARQQQKAMLDQLDDYLLPRLVQLEAPLLAVVGGSTGAGKSTLVNTVIGKVVSEPGVLRPTTRSPVLIHHPADADWFVGDRVLPGMARTSADSPGGTEDAGQLRLVAADTVPRGLAILDAPDIDSVVQANRDLATQLLAAADLWLFVTTAARYSDAVPWDFLQSASDRSTAVAVVLDRAPGETIDDITGHLAQMLLERGLGDSPLFSIQETVVDGNGMLPAQTVASIKDWLIDLAADAEARAAVVRRTLQGAVSAMVKTTPPFATAVRAQSDTAIELRSIAESAYDQAVQDLAKAAQDGTMMRGEVLARWQEFVGTGELLKGLQTNAGRLRDKVKSSLGNKPAETRDVNDAIESGLESLLREHAAEAAERAEKAWQGSAPGRQLLAAGGPELGAMSEEFPAAAGRTVREWRAHVLDLVRKEGADKRATARILEYGVNGLGLSLMVATFASGAGIPKAAETSVGAGSAVVGQKLLEAVFGDTAVQSLVEKAREDLDGKVHALMDAEFARYLAVLDQHPVDPETARQLTEAARAVEDCT